MSLHLERQRLFEERQRLKELVGGQKSKTQPTSEDMRCDTLQIIPAEEISKGNQDQKNTKELYNFELLDACVPTYSKRDDMEQWVSDTFYSYFPGFNNEYQKRQLYLQRRLQENEENLIKHQILNSGKFSRSKLNKHVQEINKPDNEAAVASARSNNSTLTSTDTGTSHEYTDADKEIINVKNHNYISSNHAVNSSVRPGSTRYRLLQDLRHTNLSNVPSGNEEDLASLNRKHVEIESARKKEYQRELMEQIEEKRRSIKFLKEKERQQEEVLTRRLQEQLKTMELEEKLEKERIKAVKIRFNAEQSRSMREHILAKLENDTKLLPADRSTSFIDENTNKENISNRYENNKVYKYFSNSEKNEYSYRKKTLIPADIRHVISQVDFPKIEKECFHISEKICPMCDGPLKEFLDFCLRCQSRITLPIKMPSLETTDHTQEKRQTFWKHNDKKEETKSNSGGSGEGSFFLVCIKCERFYSTCSTCLNKTDVCRACQSKRNVCMNCRRSLCSFCLEEVACGRNSENAHINESDTTLDTPFQVINIEGDQSETVDDNRNGRDILASDITNLSANNLSVNDGMQPYYKNIGCDSIFDPDQNSLFIYNKPSNLENQDVPPQNCNYYLQKDDLDNIKDDREKNIEKLRQQTDVRLARYLKNYGELAVQSRGTQTTSNTNARRDIVINGENSLSMPLLREMPKMTRRETANTRKHCSNDWENLQHRWDIPSVQKFTVSPTSPKVVTQIGAIRKQLQTDTFFFDDGD